MFEIFLTDEFSVNNMKGYSADSECYKNKICIARRISKRVSINLTAF